LISKDLNLVKIKNVYNSIKPYINLTPLLECNKDLQKFFNTNLFLKYEIFQKSGSFKARGAINNILSFKKKKNTKGITAVSAGNHAIAASYAANLFKLQNKIFLYKSANKYRVDICKNYNANIIFTDTENAFDNVKSAEAEGYFFVHPFDGPKTLQGSATIGLELTNYFNEINKKIDNVIISVGGGGLISGIGSYIKQIYPNAKIIGVEPEGAKGLTDSLIKKKPIAKIKVSSIADSLCAPIHMPYSFSVASKVIDQMVTVSDKQMIEFMIFAYENLKLFLEPACVAGLAAIKYKFSEKLVNQNTIVILCGSNIDHQTWRKYLLT